MKVKILQVVRLQESYDDSYGSYPEINVTRDIADWEEISEEDYKKLIKKLQEYNLRMANREIRYTLIAYNDKPEVSSIEDFNKIFSEWQKDLADKARAARKAKEKEEKEKAIKAAKKSADKAQKEKAKLLELLEKYPDKDQLLKELEND